MVRLDTASLRALRGWLMVSSMWSRLGVGFGLCMLAALLGCDSGGQRTEYANDGKVCLTIAEDGRLQARVIFRTCLSSSCHRALETSCALDVSDGKIVVTSQGARESTGESSCTDDCGELSAECRSDDAVSAGSYELSHGQDEAMAELGSEEFCFGRR